MSKQNTVKKYFDIYLKYFIHFCSNNSADVDVCFEQAQVFKSVHIEIFMWYSLNYYAGRLANNIMCREWVTVRHYSVDL